MISSVLSPSCSLVKTLSRDISPHKGVEVVGGWILRKVCAKGLMRSVLRRYA